MWWGEETLQPVQILLNTYQNISRLFKLKCPEVSIEIKAVLRPTWTSPAAAAGTLRYFILKTQRTRLKTFNVFLLVQRSVWCLQQPTEEGLPFYLCLRLLPNPNLYCLFLSILSEGVILFPAPVLKIWLWLYLSFLSRAVLNSWELHS